MAKFIKSFSAIVLCCVTAACLAQPTPGNIRISVDSRIDSMLKIRDRYSARDITIMGYVIQLYNGNIGTCRDIQAQFSEKFPEIKTELIHEEPEYKLLVGAYRTKEEAQAVLPQIRQSFAGAFIRQKQIIIPAVNSL